MVYYCGGAKLVIINKPSAKQKPSVKHKLSLKMKDSAREKLKRKTKDKAEAVKKEAQRQKAEKDKAEKDKADTATEGPLVGRTLRFVSELAGRAAYSFQGKCLSHLVSTQ